ncbi:MAG: hypothetical protein IJU33_06505 [Bacteroidales bacterium]|nr:hypothetical protein [Bacteroidales bacterium]
MKRIKLGISLICLSFFLWGCEDIPSIIKGRGLQSGKDSSPISVIDTVEEEKVDSVDFVTWINSFEIQPIKYVSVRQVLDNNGLCSVYAYDSNTKSHYAGYITTADIILYDGLKIYGDDFIMIGNYQHSFDTYPAYVRKSEMLADWSFAYSRLADCEPKYSNVEFYIHWSDGILRKQTSDYKSDANVDHRTKRIN